LARSNDASTSSKSLVLIAFVLAIAALYLGRRIFLPLALALVLSFVLAPFVILLQKLRFRRIPAVITVLVLAFSVASAVTWRVAAQMVEIMAELPNYKDNLDAKIQSLHTTKNSDLSKALSALKELNGELSSLSDQLTANRSAQSRNIRSAHPVPVQLAQPPSNLIEDLRSLLGPLAEPIEMGAMVVIFSLFMMINREDLRNRVIRLAGRGRLYVMTQALDDAGNRLSRYLLLQCLVNTSYGILFGIGLYFVGLPHALLWGVFTGVLRFIPYLGTLIAAALPTAMSLAVFPGWHDAALTFGIFVVLEIATANFVEPLLYGSHTGISSLAILVAAVFWATIWGPVGLILSTPLTVCLIVLGRHVPQLNFLEVVLGDEPVLLPEQCFYQRLLAMDQDEARSIAEEHLKTNSLENLYDSVILPALKVAEHDHERAELDDSKRRCVLRILKNLIEDLGDPYSDAGQMFSRAPNLPDGRNPLKTSVACIPAAPGADELVSMMLSQLLRQAGLAASPIRAMSLERTVQSVLRTGPKLICISSISPSSVTEARMLCRRLRANAPELQILVGFWSLDSSTAQQRLGQACPNATVKTLAEAVEQIRQIKSLSAIAETQEQSLSL
jgi:predicted PurR-regulated permease PerM